MQWIHALDVFEAGKLALTDAGREIQTIHLVGVVKVDVGFPGIDRWDLTGAAGVPMSNWRNARWCGN